MIAGKSVMLILTGALALIAAGCDLLVSGRSRREPVYVERQQYVGQPVYVQPQPVYVEPQPQYVIVEQAPPPVRIERRPPAPSGSYIWIDGSWNWDNQRYNWQAGRYVLPPQPDVIWIAPRYESAGRGYRYTPGQWSRPSGRGTGEGRGRGRGN